MSPTSKPDPVWISSMRCSSSAADRSTASGSPDSRSSPPRATSCVPLSFSTSLRFWSCVPKRVSWSMPAREMERRMADVSVGGIRVIECSPARFGESSRSAGPCCAADAGPPAPAPPPAKGAPSRSALALVVFGNAMTSRRLWAPANSMAMRSSPTAMPPCGGAPYSSASSRNPNFAFASSRPMPSISKTRSCTARSWMRIDPLPSS